MGIVDNRRLVKWLDIRYHETFPIFQKEFLVERSGVSPGLFLVAGVSEGGAGYLVTYEKDEKMSWGIEPRSALESLDFIQRYFEDTTKITDDEWDLFSLCEPEYVKGLGGCTEHTSNIELFLTGKTEYRIM